MVQGRASRGFPKGRGKKPPPEAYTLCSLHIS
jgi:hypothetical protein